MIDLGAGHPLVLVPGIQGRWEWMRPAVEALARRGRVVTYSLCGDRGSTRPYNPALGFDGFLTQIDEVLDARGVRAAAICGVSYGGLIALRYAAERPSRVTALVLVSTPGPGWRPSCKVRMYLAAPRLLSPLFALQSPFRLGREIVAAFDTWGARLGFSVRHTVRVTVNPFAPALMAQRVHIMETIDFARDCARVVAPTLVVTGEPWLDRVVPVASTREYLSAIRGATGVEIERTGHIGLVTRPDRFAEIVTGFVAACHTERRAVRA